MNRTVVVQRPDTGPASFELGAPATVGGSRADAIHAPALPPAAARLVPVPAGLVIEPAVAGVHVAGRAVAPGARRLLRPGERAELLGAALILEAEDGGTRVAGAALLRDAAAGRAPIAGPHLVVLTGRGAGERHPLGRRQVLGRGRGAGLAIADPLASRRHARLEVADGAATVLDLGAKNGVRLNGVRLDRRPRALATGDILTIGETELAYVDPAREPARLAPVAMAGEAAAPLPPGEATAPAPAPGWRTPLAAAAALLAASAALLIAGS
jgi:hypothetical protein